MATTAPSPMRVAGPGLYFDIPADFYHADPAPKPSLSSSLITDLILETPATAKHEHPRMNPPAIADSGEDEEEEKDEKKFDAGNVAHKLVLGRGRELAIVEANDWRKKVAKEARAEARANGQQPCLIGLYEKGLAMAKACFEQIAQDPENFDAFQEDAGRSEVVAIWQEETPFGKMYMRSMMDRLMNCRRRIYDYKTFKPGADPDRFADYLAREARDIQDPFYSRGVAALEGCAWDEVTFRYVVQQPDPPYLISVVELMHDPQMENSPRRWSYDRTQWAIDKWALCASRGDFPGYLPRTHHVGVPAWAQTKWALRRQADEMAERLRKEMAHG